MRVALAMILTLAACSRASEESEGKRTPIPPPPQDVRVPADLHIAVTVDGADAPAITADALAHAKPDFQDAVRRAWKLTTLLPAFARDGAIVEARGRGGVGLELDRPASASAPQPVLFLTRRGDVEITVVDPANPFPDYHGMGGRLRRPGDPTPRLAPVVAIMVSVRR
jgi:hypothetical protein